MKEKSKNQFRQRARKGDLNWKLQIYKPSRKVVGATSSGGCVLQWSQIKRDVIQMQAALASRSY